MKRRSSSRVGYNAESQSRANTKDKTTEKNLDKDNEKPRVEVRGPGRGASSSGRSSFRLSNEECLSSYKEFKCPDDFFSALAKPDYEKFMRGALKANNGPLSCMACKKQISTAMGMVLHLTARKCVSEKSGDSSKVNESRAGATHSSIEHSEVAADENSMLSKLKEEPSIWILLPHDEKITLLTNVYGTGPYACFAIPDKGKDPCPSFATIKDAVAHLDKCIKPMYFTFTGERLRVFRNLPQKLKTRYIREAMAQYPAIPCSECGRVFHHQYGLIYHIDRCNVDDEDRPWTCYRCGFNTSAANSENHLHNCWATQNTVGTTKRPAEEENTPVMGILGNVNLRSGKSIIKGIGGSIAIGGVNKVVTEATAQEAIESLVNDDYMDTDYQETPLRRRGTSSASISAGFLPPESSRVRVSNSGALRFRFRKSEITSVPSGTTDWSRYKKFVQSSSTQYEEEMKGLALCAPLSELASQDWTETTLNIEDEFDMCKQSVSFRVTNTGAENREMSSIPPGCQRIDALQSRLIDTDEDGNWTGVGYVGGPVHTVQFAPNPLSPEEEVFVVCSYPCDETLVGKDWKAGPGMVQLWILEHLPDLERSCIRPWFSFRCEAGMPLTATWLDRPRTEHCESLIGFLAVGTSRGQILIYRIDSTCAPASSTDSPILVCPEPGLVLRQPHHEVEQQDNDQDSDPGSPPIIRIAWCAKDEAQFVAGVSATGAVVIWNLTCDLTQPKFLRDPGWCSPANDVCFMKDFQLVVAFRERCIRVYDVLTWELTLEENTVRTAGARVVSNPRILPGLLTFQSEYFASTTLPSTGVSYISAETSEKSHQGYFVVPMANRHNLQTWDVGVSSLNGVVASCGVDGKLLISANGRLATHTSTADSSFCIMKEMLRITRHRVIPKDSTDSEENKPKLLESLLTHEDTCKNVWLNVALEPEKGDTRNEYSCLDLRLESLNAVATNRQGRPVVITGGQAGVLFCRPCIIAKVADAPDPTELLNNFLSMNKAVVPTPKTRKTRQKKST